MTNSNDELFTEEEKAMMDLAQGIIEEINDASSHVEKLKDTSRMLARMISEGAERERNLRLEIHDLKTRLNEAA